MTAERKQISMPADWWAAYERAADAEGMYLSEWIGQQCNQALSKSTNKQLSDRTGRGRPRKENQ